MRLPSVPLPALLSIVPYFRARGGSAPIAEAARDLGVTPAQLRAALWQLWMCGLPGYGPGDLIDLSFSADDLDEADLVEVTFTAGMDAPVRLTWTEAITLETGLAVFLDHPEVVDQLALRELMSTLREATGRVPAPTVPPDTGDDAGAVVRRAVNEGVALRFTYFSASSDSVTTRVVDPARLVIADGHSYLRGIERDSGEWKNFRTDRMGDVGEVGERRPLGPEPDLAVDGNQRASEAVVVVKGSARWFLDEFPFREVRDSSGGDLTATVAYHDREWLLRFLVGHADVLTARDPALREEVARRGRAALHAYDVRPVR